jgi:hypothetical protein
MSRQRCRYGCAAGFFLLVSLAPAAWAADGRADIEALSFNISQSGSSVVVADLYLGDADQDGVTVVTDRVTLDRNAPALAGPGSGMGTTISGVVVLVSGPRQWQQGDSPGSGWPCDWHDRFG